MFWWRQALVLAEGLKVYRISHDGWGRRAGATRWTVSPALALF